MIVPPLPVRASEAPLEAAAVSLLMAMEDEPLAVDGVAAVMTAITPFPIVAEFTPKARHVTVPGAVLQVIALPAEASAGPAATFRELILAAG